MNETTKECVGCEFLEIVSGGGNCKFNEECRQFSPIKNNFLTGEGWRNASEKPLPLKPGVVCDQFVAIPLYGGMELMYYMYETDEWTKGGGDIQKIKAWYRVPPYN